MFDNEEAFPELDDDYENEYEDDETVEEESSNKTFIVVASILGGIILLALLCVAVYALVFVPKQKADANNVAEATSVASTQVVVLLTEAAVESALLDTPLASPSPISSPTASPTPVIAVATDTPTATPNTAATGTVAAALTQAGDAILTIVPTSSELPDGGFADDVGIPSLVMLTTIFVAIIFFARKLRSTSENA